MAQARFRWRIRKERGQAVGSWVGWDLTREEKEEGEEREGDMGRWALKTWLREDGDEGKGEWKTVELVVCGLDDVSGRDEK